MSGHPILPADPITLPLLPLRDVVVFPHMVVPLFVGVTNGTTFAQATLSVVNAG